MRRLALRPYSSGFLAVLAGVLLAFTSPLHPAACNPVFAVLTVSPDDTADLWLNGNHVGFFPYVGGGCAAVPQTVTVNVAWLNAVGTNLLAVQNNNVLPNEVFCSWLLDITCVGGAHTYISSDPNPTSGDGTIISFYSPNGSPATPPGSGGSGWWDPAFTPTLGAPPTGWENAIVDTGTNNSPCITNPGTGMTVSRLSWRSTGTQTGNTDINWFRQTFSVTPPTPTVTPTPYPPGCGTPVYVDGSMLTTGQDGNNQPNSTMPFNVSVGANQLLLVQMAYQTGSAPPIASVTYAGAPMSLAMTTNSALGLTMRTYSLPNPTAGNNSVVVAFSPNSGNQQWLVQAELFSGVNQGLPLGAMSATDQTTASNNFASSLTTTGPASMAFDLIVSTQGGYTMTPGAGQVNTGITGSTSGVSAFSAYDEVDGPGPHSLSYTFTSNQKFGDQLIEIEGAAACGATDSPTPSPTVIISGTPTTLLTSTPSPSRTLTPSPTPTLTFSGTATQTASATPSATLSPSFTRTPSFSPSPSVTPPPSITPTFTATPPSLVLHLYPSSPNPAPEGVWITFYISVEAMVDIIIYDISGEKVRGLDPFPARVGNNEAFWDGRNSTALPAATGVYIYRLEATSNQNETEQVFGKCALLR